jgi:sulfur-carrier protein
MRVLYFAWVRDAVGVDEEQVDLPGAVASVADVVAHLTTMSGGHARAFAELGRIRCALDQKIVPLDAPLGDAGELAFFPPVTGG